MRTQGSAGPDLWELAAARAGTASRLTNTSDQSERLPASSPTDHPGGVQIAFEQEAKGGRNDGLYALDVPMLTNVRVNREILAAWRDEFGEERDAPDDASPGESPTRAG